MNLFCSKKSTYVLLPVLAMGTLSSLSFYWGGAAEEFCIPLMAWSFYMSVRYFMEDYPKVPDWKMILLNGIFAGIIMQVKYIMLIVTAIANAPMQNKKHYSNRIMFFLLF